MARKRKVSERYLFQEIGGEMVATPSPQWEQEQRERRFTYHLKQSGIPEDYWDLDFADYRGSNSVSEFLKIQDYGKRCREEKFHNVSLYLHGSNSSQKTMLACAAAKEFLRQGLIVKFLQAGDFITDLLQLQSYGRKQEDLDRIKMIQEKSDLIILDDAWDSKKSPLWANSGDLMIAAWDTFLRKTLSNDVRLIITGNGSLESIKGAYGISIFELIERNAYILQFRDSISRVRKARFEGLFDIDGKPNDVDYTKKEN